MAFKTNGQENSNFHKFFLEAQNIPYTFLNLRDHRNCFLSLMPKPRGKLLPYNPSTDGPLAKKLVVDVLIRHGQHKGNDLKDFVKCTDCSFSYSLCLNLIST